MLRTSHDLARVMNQSDETARRVLREVFPRRGDRAIWRLDDKQWYLVLYHIERNKPRHFGKVKPRKKEKIDSSTLDMTVAGLFQ